MPGRFPAVRGPRHVGAHRMSASRFSVPILAIFFGGSKSHCAKRICDSGIPYPVKASRSKLEDPAIMWMTQIVGRLDGRRAESDGLERAIEAARTERRSSRP